MVNLIPIAFLDNLTEEEITSLVDTITLRDKNQNVSFAPYDMIT